MRICLVTHGLPPHELTGVENYTLALAQGLARAGHQVEVFAARRAPELPDRSLRREVRDGWAVTWVATNDAPRDPVEALDPPGLADAFERFLQRERPELVHFQHVIKLGLGLIERAVAAGIPTVYTAHDYYPICHRFTLLRPDLSRCTTIGDPAACARCDLALALLNRQAGLGDYQMGALPEQLGDAARVELATLLGGDEAGSGVDPNELRAVRARRAALDQRRREVYARLDLVLAPTRYLRERLIEGGLAPERVQVLPYGIEVADLRGLEPRAGAGSGALQVGFLGGHSKHKGVHVLLEAWGLLAQAAGAGFERKAQLSIFGGSSDADYGARLRAQAAAVGAAWRGPYARAELPRIFGALDLVVVPSIWVENQPIVIREALAAGRPVLASRVGALPESVREGVDGWLFEVGDATALARVLGGVIEDRAELRRIAQQLEPVKDLPLHVRELAQLYAGLRAARRTVDVSGLPEHVREPALQHAALVELPTRELYARVLAGLERLAGVWQLCAPTTAELLTAALGQHSRTQEFLDDGREERSWHGIVHQADESGLRALQERLAWREQTLAEHERELAWMRDNQVGVERERAWLRESLAHLEAERTWLRTEVSARDQTLAWRAEQVSGLEHEALWRREQVAGFEAERVWLREEVSARQFELEWLREELGPRLAQGREQLGAVSERCAAMARAAHALLADTAVSSDGLRRAATLLREQNAQLHAAISDFLARFPPLPAAPHAAAGADGAQPLQESGAAPPPDADGGSA